MNRAPGAVGVSRCDVLHDDLPCCGDSDSRRRSTACRRGSNRDFPRDCRYVNARCRYKCDDGCGRVPARCGALHDSMDDAWISGLRSGMSHERHRFLLWGRWEHTPTHRYDTAMNGAPRFVSGPPAHTDRSPERLWWFERVMSGLPARRVRGMIRPPAETLGAKCLTLHQGR